jgi:hypothetical protein
VFNLDDLICEEKEKCEDVGYFSKLKKLNLRGNKLRKIDGLSALFLNMFSLLTADFSQNQFVELNMNEQLPPKNVLNALALANANNHTVAQLKPKMYSIDFSHNHNLKEFEPLDLKHLTKVYAHFLSFLNLSTIVDKAMTLNVSQNELELQLECNCTRALINVELALAYKNLTNLNPKETKLYKTYSCLNKEKNTTHPFFDEETNNNNNNSSSTAASDLPSYKTYEFCVDNSITTISSHTASPPTLTTTTTAEGIPLSSLSPHSPPSLPTLATTTTTTTTEKIHEWTTGEINNANQTTHKMTETPTPTANGDHNSHITETMHTTKEISNISNTPHMDTLTKSTLISFDPLSPSIKFTTTSPTTEPVITKTTTTTITTTTSNSAGKLKFGSILLTVILSVIVRIAI